MPNRATHFAIALACIMLLTGLGPCPSPVAGEACTAPLAIDNDTASGVLSSERPFHPLNPDLFFSYANPDWVNGSPAEYPGPPAMTAGEIRLELKQLLERRFPCSPERVQAGLAVFDGPIAAQKLPDPTLRAALAALTGTIGEPAIDFLLYEAPVTSIYFGIVIHSRDGLPTGITGTVYELPDGTWTIVFDSRIRYVSFSALSALLFHESLHIEFPAESGGEELQGAGFAEETIAVSLESIVYMQMLLTDPATASLPDILTRGANNPLALARLNSGLAGTDRLNLFLPGNATSLSPLTATPLTQFADFYAMSDYDGADLDAWQALETGGNTLLASVLPLLAGDGTVAPESPDFDQATLTFVDQHQGALSSAQLVEVACILQLSAECA